MGTLPLDPVTVNPSSSQSFQFILTPVANPALLATVTDAATGAGLNGANVTIAKGGFSETQTTGQATVSQSDWSGGQYTSQNGGMDTTAPGVLRLLANASSRAPASQPPQTGAGSIEFQVAANNDNATWNFVGPDGTGASYFTSPSSTLPTSLSGNRYFRYEVFMSTQSASSTPSLTNFTLAFSANCVPPAQTLFTGLPQGAYTVSVSAPNYNNGSSTVSVGAGFTSSTISLIHQ
jgi:hypothetical protein